jgi:hypothetical protein
MSAPGADKKPNDLKGISEGTLTARWADGTERRAAARAKAQRELERTRRRELKRAASVSRKDSLARGATTYIGIACRFHPTNRVRYTSSHHCIECDRLRSDRRRQRQNPESFGQQGQRKPRAPRADQRHTAFIIQRPLRVKEGSQ